MDSPDERHGYVTVMKAHNAAAVDCRYVHPTMDAGRSLWRWHRAGDGDLPDAVECVVDGDPRLPVGQFSGAQGRDLIFGPVLGPRFDGLLRASGVWLPVTIDGQESGYRMFVCTTVVDCLDVRRSSRPGKHSAVIKYPVFDGAKVPGDLPAFRVPQSPETVLFNEWAMAELVAGGDGQIDALTVWSSDPRLRSHTSWIGKGSVAPYRAQGRLFDNPPPA